MSNYATKSDLEKATDFDTSKLDKKVDLTNLKSKIDKSYIGKLETTPVNLSKLSNVARNKIVKKTVYNLLVKKCNFIQITGTSNLVKELTITQKLVKLKREYLIIIMPNISLLKNLINWRQKISKWNWHKQI